MNTATDAQISFIQALLETRDTTGIDVQNALEMARQLWRLDAFDKAGASALIDLLKEQPKLEQPASEDPPEGMHKVGDDIYKVQRAVHGSGRLYAKRLNVVPNGDRGYDVHFVYAPGVVRALSEATKMSLEEAKRFGALYGTCCVCGRTLTDETSIEAGIGPVCAGRF